MAVYNLDPFPNDDVAKDWKERKDGRKGGFAVNDEERDIVDFEPVCQVSYACSTGVGMSNDDHLVASVDKFLV